MLRRLFTLIPFVFVGGSALLLFLINLSGATSNLTFLNKFYFSSVTTTEETRWTMYAICTPAGEGNVSCSTREAAYPYSPADNFGKSLVPEDFVKNRNTYYYLLRIAYAWFVLALLFSLLSLMPILWSCCFKGFLTGFFASFIIGTALFFTILGALFITAAHAKGVAAFKKAGYTAALGRNMILIVWLSVALLLASWLWMILVGVHGAKKTFESNSDSEMEKGHNESDLE